MNKKIEMMKIIVSDEFNLLKEKRQSVNDYEMEKLKYSKKLKKNNMEVILKKAPTCSVIANNESIRFDSLSNLIDDVEHEIHIIEEEELIEDAKETLGLVKQSNVRPYTFKQYKDAYDDIKREYKELKDYLKYLKGGK